MNETMKRAAAIVLAVVALGAAVFTGYKFLAPPALEPGVTHQSPAKSMAQMEKERMQREDAAVAKGQGAASESAGDDASGKQGGQR